MMPRWYDHSIIAVKDLPGAMTTYRRLGFYLTPRMYHSFGTSNALIMFDGNFLELLGDLEKSTRDGPGQMDVGEHQGLWRAAYLSRDASADFVELTAAGLEMTPVFDFTRPVPMPDGREGTIDCSVTIAPRTDDRGLQAFVSNQRRPEFLWVPEWQTHPNGVQRLESLVCVSDNPARHRAYFETFVGPTACAADDGSLLLTDVDGTKLEIHTPEKLARRFPGSTFTRSAALQDHGVGVSLRTSSLTMLKALLTLNGVPFIDTSPRSIIVQAVDACGVILEFVSAR